MAQHCGIKSDIGGHSADTAKEAAEGTPLAKRSIGQPGGQATREPEQNHPGCAGRHQAGRGGIGKAQGAG